MSAQDTIRLDSTSFYRISGTAFGKAIVYAQRNVQLKREGNYYAKVNDGEVNHIRQLKFGLKNPFLNPAKNFSS